MTPPESLATRARDWASPLVRAAGDAFTTLYMHGSALAPGFDAQTSDVNLLLVVRELGFARLQALARELGQLGGKNPAPPRFTPLVLTESQVRTSVDVFPLEFLDLTMRRALLAGQDVLAGVEVGRANLRHQCEYELRSKLVGLRQAYLLSGAAPGVAPRLLAQAAGGSAAVLRHLLTLRDAPVPDDPRQVVAVVARLYGVDAGALDAPFAMRREPVPNDELAAARLGAYLVALEALIAAVDGLPNA